MLVVSEMRCFQRELRVFLGVVFPLNVEGEHELVAARQIIPEEGVELNILPTHFRPDSDDLFNDRLELMLLDVAALHHQNGSM